MLRPLLATLVATSLAIPASAQAIHRWDFSGTGTTVFDRVGTVDGTIIGGATLNGTGELLLDGLDDHVEFPSGILGDLNAATFEAWYRWDDASAPDWSRVMDFGSSSGGAGQSGTGLTYVVMTPQGNLGSEPLGIIKDDQNPNSTRAPGVATTALGTVAHIALTIDSDANEMELYYDGAPQGAVFMPDELRGVDDVNNWLGRSQWQNNPFFEGMLTEFRIYDRALSDLEIAVSYSLGPDAGSIGTNYCGPAPINSSGGSARMSADGSTLISANAVTLTCSDMPRFVFGFVIVSRTQGFIQNPAGSAGHLCVSGAIGRYVGPGEIMNSGTNGAISIGIDLNGIPQPNGLVQAMPGESWNWQTWFRDSVGGTVTSNFSDGIEIVLQ